jgi:hypothetical protein
MCTKYFVRRIASLASSFFLVVSCRLCLADTTDLTEFLSGNINVWRCAGTGSDSLAVFADVDGNSINDTLVVFTSIQGEAKAEFFPGAGYGSYDYFFTGDRSNCGGGTGGLGRVGVRFVDMLATGFNANDPRTWTYRSVAGVLLVVHSDVCNEDSSSTPYRQVNAYSQTNGGGTLLSSFTTGYPAYANQLQSCDFTSVLGVKEIQIRTDFCENDIRYLVIHSNATSGGSDMGLRAYDGTTTNRIAFEFPVGTNNLLSPVHITKNGVNYGIILTDTNSPSASRIRVQTSSGTKAWAKLP